MRLYARLYLTFVRNYLTRETKFSVNFLSLIIADLFGLATVILFSSIVYSKVETLGGWIRWETLFFLGTFSLIDAANMTVWMRNTFRLPEYVRTGELDLILTKPVDSQFYAMTRHFHLGHIGQAVGALVLLAYSWRHLGVRLSLLKLVLTKPAEPPWY